MSKKNFTGGLNSVLGETSPEPEPETNRQLTEQYSKKKKRGRPKTQDWKITKSSEEGTLQDETRATFIVKKELLGKLKGIAYWERMTIKELINTALTEAITKYEKESGSIKPAPETKQ